MAPSFTLVPLRDHALANPELVRTVADFEKQGEAVETHAYQVVGADGERMPQPIEVMWLPEKGRGCAAWRRLDWKAADGPDDCARRHVEGVLAAEAEEG